MSPPAHRKTTQVHAGGMMEESDLLVQDSHSDLLHCSPILQNRMRSSKTTH